MADATPSPDRLTRLEEHHAFADRTIEQLGDEILHLSRRLHLALERVDRLETRLGELMVLIESGPDDAPHTPGDDPTGPDCRSPEPGPAR